MSRIAASLSLLGASPVALIAASRTAFGVPSGSSFRRLTKAKKMTRIGLEKVRRQMNQEYVHAKDVIAALKKDAKTWKHFQSFPESYQRIRVGWIDAARHRPEIFQQRLRYFIKMTAQNKRLGMVQ